MLELPATAHIRLEPQGPVLRLWLDRPQLRNAMSGQMVREIFATFEAIRDDRNVRVVVLRGAGGTFCAGADIKNMAVAPEAPAAGARDELKESNRRFGAMLAAVSPFVVRRIGLTAARRLGVSGARLDGGGAREIGIAHLTVEGSTQMDAAIAAAIHQILQCAPEAVAETKRLMLRAAGPAPMAELLDQAAESFVRAVRSPEGREGTKAFVEKRKPAWATRIE